MNLRLSLLLCVAPVLFSLPVQAQSTACDRSCLDAMLDQYLDALLRHDPARAPLASAYRHTENSVVQPLGEGMWKTASALGAGDRRYYDPVTHNAVYYGIIEESGQGGSASLLPAIDRSLIA